MRAATQHHRALQPTKPHTFGARQSIRTARLSSYGACRASPEPVFDIARGLGLEKSLQPAADFFKSFGLPDVAVHWLHPINMAVVLFVLGTYTTYLGWQIRVSSDGATLTKAKDLHPKLSVAMAAFFTAGAIGGMIALVMQGQPVFSSAHVKTGIIGLLLLYLQGMLSLFFEDDPNARGLHAFFGTGIMALFVVHAGLGLQLGLSF